MVRIPDHLTTATEITTYLEFRSGLAEELREFRSAYPLSKRLVPPDHWSIWDEVEGEDEEFTIGWRLSPVVKAWLDAHCPGWADLCNPEGRITFHLGFAKVSHMGAFRDRWERHPPPVLISVLGFEPDRWMTLAQLDRLLDYVGLLEREVAALHAAMNFTFEVEWAAPAKDSMHGATVGEPLLKAQRS